MDDNYIANIHLALADKVLSSVVEKKTAKEIWDTLIKLWVKVFTQWDLFKKETIPSKGRNRVSVWPQQHNKNCICIAHHVGSENRGK